MKTVQEQERRTGRPTEITPTNSQPSELRTTLADSDSKGQERWDLNERC